MDSMTAEERARLIAHALFHDVRDRRLLKWFFTERPMDHMPIFTLEGGERIMPFDSDVQNEIWKAWFAIVEPAIRAAEQAAAEKARAEAFREAAAIAGSMAEWPYDNEPEFSAVLAVEAALVRAAQAQKENDDAR